MSARDKSKGKTVIGWSEYVGFPDWGIDGVKAKTDTGARTSALHVEDLTELSDGRVEFDVVYGSRSALKRRRVSARVVKRARVRSSTGVYKSRYFVRAVIRIGEVIKEIEISLVSREKMLFRMLLGRKALEHDFIVDVSHRRRLSRRPPVKRKINPA